MIELEHVTKTFGRITAVQDLCLKIPKGELFCFIGPNGAGKTTTIKLLCGLLHPTAGRIRIGKIDLQNDPFTPHKFIGYISDSPFLYDLLTPEEFFEFTGDLYQIPQDVIIRERSEYFTLFDLWPYAQTLIKDLSHGLRQRLIYAATLLHKPTVLFVDEPLVGLDPFSIRLIRSLFRQKVAEGMTVFLTTHILSLAEDLADRIGIIYEGRMIAVGSLAELKTQSAIEGPLEDIFLQLTSGKR